MARLADGAIDEVLLAVHLLVVLALAGAGDARHKVLVRRALERVEQVGRVLDPQEEVFDPEVAVVAQPGEEVERSLRHAHTTPKRTFASLRLPLGAPTPQRRPRARRVSASTTPLPSSLPLPFFFGSERSPSRRGHLFYAVRRAFAGITLLHPLMYFGHWSSSVTSPNSTVRNTVV